MSELRAKLREAKVSMDKVPNTRIHTIADEALDKEIITLKVADQESLPAVKTLLVIGLIMSCANEDQYRIFSENDQLKLIKIGDAPPINFEEWKVNITNIGADLQKTKALIKTRSARGHSYEFAPLEEADEILGDILDSYDKVRAYSDSLATSLKHNGRLVLPTSEEYVELMNKNEGYMVHRISGKAINDILVEGLAIPNIDLPPLSSQSVGVRS